EENFARAEGSLPPARPAAGPRVLVHSGLLYPSERDPRAFYDAIAGLKAAGRIGTDTLRVVLRASGFEAYHRRCIEALGIQDIVFLAPVIPYEAALQEMLAADGLLLFQAANCNEQIPAKIYEYLRAGRPIFAMTDRAGDTARLLLDTGIDTLAQLDDRQGIAASLMDFLERLETGRAPVAAAAEARRHSRRARTRELAALLDGVVPRL
nr:glycosyltransferase [Pseudomonadota bacterium]